MTMHKPVLFLLLCLLPELVRAAEPVSHVFEVDGRSYTVYVKNQRALVLPATVGAKLEREARVPMPNCKALDDSIAAWRLAIQDCRAGSPSACNSVQTVVGILRTDEDMFGKGTLRQSWSLSPELPVPDEPGPRVLAEAARLTGLPENSIIYHLEGVATGQPSTATVAVDPAGQSAASRLAGLISYESVAFSNAQKAFLTNDTLVTCGLLAGDVKLLWAQERTISAGRRAGPLSAGQLWEIYNHIKDMGAIPSAEPKLRAIQVGARIGVAYKSAQISNDDLEMKVDLVLEALFELTTLALRSDINREQLENKFGEVKFLISIPWKSVGAR